MFTGTADDLIIGPGYIEITQLGNTYCLGYTLGGIGIKLDTDWANLTHMATIGFYDRKKIAEDLAIRATLLEATLTNLKLAWAGYGLLAGTCIYGGDSIDLDEIQLKFIGPSPECKRREITVYKVVAFEVGEYIASKNAPTVIPVIFRALEDMSRPAGRRMYQICDFPDRDFNLLAGIED